MGLCTLLLATVAALFAIIIGAAMTLAPAQMHPLPTPEGLRELRLSARVGNRTLRERSESPISRIDDIAYIILARDDSTAADAEGFFQDFGLLRERWSSDSTEMWQTGDAGIHGNMPTAYYRCRGGTGLHCVQVRKASPATTPTGLIGFGFVVSDSEALKRLAALPGAALEEVAEERGGGQKVSLRDPDGILIEVRSGHTALEVLPMQPPYVLNTALHKKNRAHNAPFRPAYAPPDVWRLAHCVYFGTSIMRSIEWYQDTLGLIVSDFQFLPIKDDHRPVVAFMRPDRGDTPTDHHAFALASVPKAPGALEHCAFEVQDWDAIGEGNRFMQMRVAKGRKYTHAWGIGRHFLGSNLFDYWRDPFGHMFEHTTDTDQLDANFTTGYWLFTQTAQASIGPAPGDYFLDEGGPPATLFPALKRILTGEPKEDDYAGLEGLQRFLGLIRANLFLAHVEHDEFRVMK